MLFSIFLFLIIGIILGFINPKPSGIGDVGLQWGAKNYKDLIFNMNYLKYSLLSGIGVATLISVYKKK